MFAQRIRSADDGMIKVVVQTIDQSGHPDAVHPLMLEWMDITEFEKLVDQFDLRSEYVDYGTA